MMLTGWWKCLGFSSPQQSPLESLLRLLLSRKPSHPTATSYLTQSVVWNLWLMPWDLFILNCGFVLFLFLFLCTFFFSFWCYSVAVSKTSQLFTDTWISNLNWTSISKSLYIFAHFFLQNFTHPRLYLWNTKIIYFFITRAYCKSI